MINAHAVHATLFPVGSTLTGTRFSGWGATLTVDCINASNEVTLDVVGELRSEVLASLIDAFEHKSKSLSQLNGVGRFLQTAEMDQFSTRLKPYTHESCWVTIELIRDPVTMYLTWVEQNGMDGRQLPGSNAVNLLDLIPF